MRLFSLSLSASLAVSALAATVPSAAPFKWMADRQAPRVCSIPLASPKPPLPRTPDRAKILRVPPSNTLDHNQIPPPAPPCDQRSKLLRAFPVKTHPNAKQ